MLFQLLDMKVRSVTHTINPTTFCFGILWSFSQRQLSGFWADNSPKALLDDCQKYRKTPLLISSTLNLPWEMQRNGGYNGKAGRQGESLESKPHARWDSEPVYSIYGMSTKYVFDIRIIKMLVIGLDDRIWNFESFLCRLRSMYHVTALSRCR